VSRRTLRIAFTVAALLAGIAVVAASLVVPALLLLHTDEMASPDMHSFWAKARAARMNVTSGDEAEDLFTTEIDRACAAATPPPLHRSSNSSGTPSANGAPAVGSGDESRAGTCC
jgi:hypothetical protein